MATQIEAGLRDQEHESAYRAIFEASSDGLVINDLETGVVLQGNSAFCSMRGYETMTGLHPTPVRGIRQRHPKRARISLSRDGGVRDGT